MAEKTTAAPWELPYPTSAGEAKLGATDFEELAERATKIFKEKILIIKKYSGSGTLASGELAIQEETGKTFTLPSAATANQVIGIFSKVAELKITSASETFGPGLKAAAWKMTTGQGATLQSDGTNWLMTPGSEYKHETKYVGKNFTKAEAEAGFVVSATRPAHMELDYTAAGTIEIGGVAVLVASSAGVGYWMVWPGETVKANVAVETFSKLL